MVCLPCDFKILLKVFNQSYSCQTSHYLGRKWLPKPFLILPSLLRPSIKNVTYILFSAQLYASTILASSLTYSASPIFFEFCVEIAYPVPEGIVGGFLTCFYNICGMIFLFLFYIPNICKYKMDSLYRIRSKMLHSAKVIIFIIWH